MDLTLKRTLFRPDGIFGELCDASGARLAYTLEHAYPNTSGLYADAEGKAPSVAPKIPPGTYICVRGPHRLSGMTKDFETFEITGVAGHSGLLFHAGNTNGDSSGCVLLGKGLVIERKPDGIARLTESRATFAQFLAHQAGLSAFSLTVE